MVNRSTLYAKAEKYKVWEMSVQCTIWLCTKIGARIPLSLAKDLKERINEELDDLLYPVV